VIPVQNEERLFFRCHIVVFVSRHFSNRKAILFVDGVDAGGDVVAGGVDEF
jgi:hypothetical protein